MTLQSGFCLCPDLGTDSKWSAVDLRNLFDLNGLSDMWNELVRTGELVLNNDCEYISKYKSPFEENVEHDFRIQI